MAHFLPEMPPTAAERWYKRGAELARLGRYHEAVEPLEQALAYSNEQSDPNFQRALRSYYGLSIAMAHGDVLRGLRLCNDAIARGPLRADLYMNLARVAMKSGRKNLAIESLWTSLSISPNDRNAWTMMAQLGYRRPPVLEFLPRTNPVNKYLGLIRHRVLGMNQPPL